MQSFARINVRSSHPSGGSLEFEAVFERVAQGYIGFVEDLPGASTQAPTLREAHANIKEAIQLVLDAHRALEPSDA